MSMISEVAEKHPLFYKEFIAHAERFHVRNAGKYSNQGINEQGELRDRWEDRGLYTPFGDVAFQLANEITIVCSFYDKAGAPYDKDPGNDHDPIKDPRVFVRIIHRDKGNLEIIPYAFLISSDKAEMKPVNLSKTHVKYEDTTQFIRQGIDIILYTFIAIILDLGNLWTEYVEEPVKLNKKRAKHGKPPIQSFYILHIGKKKVNKSEGGGHHASPAMHTRRGHFRRYRSGNTVWIRDTVVGNARNGIVRKEYSI